MKRILLLCLLLSLPLFGQTTSTITGTIESVEQQPVSTGKVTFTVSPNTDVTLSSIARVTTQTTTCLINSSGNLTNLTGGACVITMNTALQPSGSGYITCFWPYNVKTACIYMYATASTIDISTVVSTPENLPDQGGVVDDFSNQNINGTKTFVNAPVFPAGYIDTAPQAFVGVSVTNPGVFNSTQMNQYLTSAVGGINLQTELPTVFGNSGVTEGITGGVNCIGGSNQCNGVAGYVVADAVSSPLGTDNSAVGLFGQARMAVSGSAGWGMNSVIADSALISGQSMIGYEDDVNVLGSPAEVWGFQINSGPITGTMPPAPAVGAREVYNAAAMIYLTDGTALSGGQWPAGIVTGRAVINGPAFQADGTCYTGPCSSQTIVLCGYDSSNNAHCLNIEADQNGNLDLNPANGESVVGANIPIVTSFTTTATTTNTVPVTGMTSGGHCILQPTNSAAAAGQASVYVSAKTTNQITVAHTATAGWTFDVMCTSN
jgi:hypothetical protein